MKLTVSNEIMEKVPMFRVIAYTLDIDNAKTKEVSNYLENLKDKYTNKYLPEEIVKIPKLKETRDGYKKFGKDPSHTRPACEALLRRFVKGNGIYQLGDIIDLGNIVSVETMRSVCVVDADLIKGNINIRLGKENEPYEAINRGSLNIYKLPVYEDSIGPFGTPTSDTLRTCVNNNTKTILIMIICFGVDDLENDEKLMLDLYTKYAHARNIKKIEVDYGKF